jgi:hypothetical protein
LLVACGGEQQQTEIKKEITSENPEEVEIRAMIGEYFDRVREGDKTVLYENEFSYYTDEKTLDDYMALSRVLDYKYDTLGGITVDSITLMDDSAWMWLKVTYNSADGSQRERPYRLVAYHNQGRWVRPYLSRWNEEAEYLEQRRIYDSVTAAEEGE